MDLKSFVLSVSVQWIMLLTRLAMKVPLKNANLDVCRPGNDSGVVCLSALFCHTNKDALKIKALV